LRVLIVEDDPHKLTQLRKEVAGTQSAATISVAMSLQEATDILSSNDFEVVLLDMAIPSHGGETVSTDVYSQPVGGLDVLLFLSSNGRSERVIVLTQYPTIEYNRQHVPLRKVRDRIVEDGVGNLEAVVLFADDGNWKIQLQYFLRAAS
jgi:DNA-binding response OmpR family regulator